MSQRHKSRCMHTHTHAHNSAGGITLQHGNLCQDLICPRGEALCCSEVHSEKLQLPLPWQMLLISSCPALFSPAAGKMLGAEPPKKGSVTCNRTSRSWLGWTAGLCWGEFLNCWQGAEQFQRIPSNLSAFPLFRRSCSLSVEDSLVHCLDITLISSLYRGKMFNCRGLFCDLWLKFHIIGFYLLWKNPGIGPCEYLKIKSSINPQMTKNNYHAGN